MNLSSLLFIIVIILVTQVGNHGYVKSSVAPDLPGTPESKDCFAEAKRLLVSSDGLLGVATNSTNAAKSAVSYCMIECIKIFEKAGKSLLGFNFPEVANQVKEFGLCFLECLKKVYDALTTSVGSARKFTSNLLGSRLLF